MLIVLAAHVMRDLSFCVPEYSLNKKMLFSKRYFSRSLTPLSWKSTVQSPCLISLLLSDMEGTGQTCVGADGCFREGFAIRKLPFNSFL